MKTKSKVLYKKTKKERNASERNRIKCLNSVYEKLKKHVPDAAKVKKISKFNLIMNAIKYIQLLKSKLSVGIHKNQYYYEHLSQSTNDQSIIEEKFNQDITQEINLSDHVQYNNNFFQDLENVIREDYSQCFETSNQQTNTYYNNQYIDEYIPNNKEYCQQFYQSNNSQYNTLGNSEQLWATPGNSWEIPGNSSWPQYIDEYIPNNKEYCQQFYQSNNSQYNIQDFENCNQQIHIYNYNQYNNEYRHNNHYLSEQTNKDQIISEHNFNQNISQSFSQEINSFDCFQYNNNPFQYLQNVI